MKKTVLILMIALFSVIDMAKAVTAYPYPMRFVQPDKTTVLTLTMKGDERIKWAETEDGYSLIYNDEGYFCYATKDENGDMVPSQYIATDIAARSAEVEAFLAQTPKRLFYSDSQVKTMLQLWKMLNECNDKSYEKAATLGTVKFPVILASFSNRAFQKTKAQFNTLLNQMSGSNSNSVRSFYNENSYGKMQLEFVVIGPVQLPRTIAYYGNNSNGNSQQFARDAITLANDSVDFSQFDNDNDGYVDGVHIFFAGYGEESSGGADCIWSHRGTLLTACAVDGRQLRDYSCSPELRGNSGSSITNIGVICHELGHVFGAPDFYDTDYESSGGKYPGTGTWDIMASGSWNGNGATPAHHNPYTKCYIYHWATPRTISSPEAIVMLDAETHPDFLRVETTTRNEYFLLENRQNHKFDASIPGYGLLIYRAHGNGVPGYNVNTTHPQKFYVVTSVNSNAIPTGSVASYGTVESGSCPFGAYRNAFTDNTTPSQKSWAGNNTDKPLTNITRVTRNKTVCFTFMGADINPGSFMATPATAHSIKLTWGLWDYKKVLLVYSANGVFGTPQGDTYTNGDAVTGGGTVIYQGYNTSFVHSGLNPNTLCKYKIYSLNDNGTWTSGVEASATTPQEAYALPHTENFDADSNNLPAYWTSECTSNNYQWRVAYGNNNAYAPYSPTNCMFCAATDQTYDNNQAILATAPVNTSTVSPAHISFWIRNQKRLTYQDVLEVKYRTSLADDWTTLAIYNSSITAWREESLNLPSAPFLQVAFVGTAHFGRGIGIDNVTFAQGSVGINTAIAEDIDVNIYPNPASNVVNISALNSNENIGYEVYDLMGRCLIKGEVNAHQNASIATSDWKAGVYVVRLRAGNNEKTRQLIVK